MAFFFLDLVGRERNNGQIELRAPTHHGEVSELSNSCCDLLIQATIEVVVITAPNGIPRLDLLHMLSTAKDRIWDMYGHLAYEVDENGKRITQRSS